LLNEAVKYPQAFFWYLQKIIKNETKIDLEIENSRFFETFFSLLYELELLPDKKDFVKKMVLYITKNRYANVRKIFESSSEKSVKEILLLSTKCQSFSEHDIKIFQSLAEVAYPQLNQGKSDEDEEDSIWTTSEGYEKRKEKIAHIANVELIEIAKEIEIARSYGDLRENSEFKFALEKQKDAQARLSLLSNEFDKMVVINPSTVQTDQVDVGVIVTLESSDQKKLEYTLLGPEDANPEKNILFYKSKLALSMKGLSVGQTCHAMNKEWKITKIRSFWEEK